jgi:hypothetical protein
MTAVAAESLAEYAGQKVVLTYTNKDGNEVKLEGTAEAASAAGLVIKPKGRQNLELIEPDQIKDIAYAPDKPKKLAQGEVLNLKYGQGRKHILDRHGIALSEAEKLPEEDALNWHKGVDHTDLGHVHVETKTKAKKDEAEGDSEESPAEES